MSSTTLCFDFGNTRLKAGIFKDGRLLEVVTLPEDSQPAVMELVKKYQPSRSILSSVIDHAAGIESALASHTKFHKLTAASGLPFTTPVGKPATIGADRLALAAAAVHMFPAANNLVIGSGTCITYNFINKNGEFLGGGISPGLQMRLRSLHEYTAKLPLVQADWNTPLVGYDTATNILSGVVLGLAHEIDGFIADYQERYDNFNVLLTGGDTSLLGAHLKKKIFAHPELIFEGLYAISEVNNP